METEPRDTDSVERSARRKRAVWVTVAVLFAALVAIVTVGSSPRVCGLCHSAQVAAMEDNSHASTRCYDCHIDNGIWGFASEKHSELVHMYPAALMGKGLTRPAHETGRGTCLSCHSDVLVRVTSSNGLSIKHATCAAGPTCDKCHSVVAHGDAVRWSMDPSMDACVACHTSQGVSTECEVCHTSEDEDRTAIRGAWQVTHGPDWKDTHGMGDQSSCATCHPSGFCEKCHGVPVPHPADFGAKHGAYAQDDMDSCTACHKSTQDFCDKCHTIDMPHPAGFLEKHDQIAEGREDKSCLRCHVETDCEECHGNHIHPGQGTPSASGASGSEQM